ncbi:MAG: hypothetical protein LC102_09615 [Ignavibacteriales bacterium]|nr:MAG: hypothetical protein F9K26_01245 [Ignavibacteriaceae bacterium]MBW7872035.1 hypothetical protein [Ignavibacteria bacterium]MCZ2143670.1 hypothetical protein [Ignavibacteriales bacterium]OQY75806.1 MAG: hypothetical protein B6D45_05085 [Ignavibacteriales bacterium UTCHB3]MBV6446067.1 hypothetical protein [Ignavibacteriaceae bacterium]
MRTFFYLIFLICITFYSISAQKTHFALQSEIGDFNRASAFALSPEGFFFVCDIGNSQVLKLDSLGNILNTAGGYGWNSGGLTTPVDVIAEAVYVLVADEENNKINKYDKNLNLASSFSKRETVYAEAIFGYPLSVAVSTLGDLYVLDGENNRVVYYSFFGDYKGNFGGFNSGFYTLNRPGKLAALKNSIAVLDGTELVFFDLFGNFIKKSELDQKYHSVKLNEGVITLTSEDQILRAPDNGNPEFIPVKINFKADDSENESRPGFVDSIISGDNLYILTENTILIFRKEGY